MKLEIKSGDVVVCLDDSDVKDLVRKDELYSVQESIHQGLLLKIDGVVIPLAGSRFQPIKFNGDHWAQAGLRQRRMLNELS